MTIFDGYAPLSRRGFLARGIATSAVFASSAFMARSAQAGASGGSAQGAQPAVDAAAKPKPGPFALAALPYKEDALAPHITANTMSFHYGKHHKGYVDKLNTLVAGKKYADMPLDQVVVASAKEAADVAIFNNAAQAWNHAFYWQSMKPGGGGEPSGKLADKIKAAFTSLDAFKTQFKDAAMGQFGSGWAWLVLQDGNLAIQKTSNADTPVARGQKPLLVIDVWEHAYYLDYQNKRADYVTAFVDKLINWEFAAANLG